MARVLIVDDDPGSRTLLARLLTRDLHAQVAEASNGLEALDRLSREAFSLVLLDARMPILDGVETLEVIRGTKTLQHLPVCMMTVDRQESLVQRAIALGVSDFILKPLNTRTLMDRLGTLIQSTDTFSGATRRLALEARTRVMIVDRDPEFRKFFVNHVTVRCNVTECDSGVEALKHCLKYFPDAIFVGGAIGLVSRDMVVKKVRAMSAGTQTLVIGIVDEPSPSSTPPDKCDGILVRSLNQDTFWNNLMEAVGLEDFTLHADSPIVKSVIVAVQQVCAMQLGLEVRPAQRVVDDHRRDWCCARLDVSALDLSIGIEAGMPIASLRDALGIIRKSASPYEIGDEDISEAVRSLAETAGTRLVGALSERGMSARVGSATITIVERGGEDRPADGKAVAAALVNASGEVQAQLALWQQN